MKIIETEQEFLLHNEMVIVSNDLAKKLSAKIKDKKLIPTSKGKNVILKAEQVALVKEALSKLRSVGRPKIDEDPTGLVGKELLRYKNRIWKRQSRERLKNKQI